MGRIPCAPTLQSRLTVLGAGQLGQDTEGAGLGGAGPGVPVLRVLDQPLLAGVAQLIVRFQVQLPVGRRSNSRVTMRQKQDASFFLSFFLQTEQMVKMF